MTGAYLDELIRLDRELRRDLEAYRHFLRNPGAGSSHARDEWRARVDGLLVATEAVAALVSKAVGK